MDGDLIDEENEDTEEQNDTHEECSPVSKGIYRVLLTSPNVPKEALEILRETCEIHILPSADDSRLFIRYAQGMDGILIDNPTFHLDKEFFRGAGVGLKVVSVVGLNGDQIDLNEAEKRKVKIGVCPSDLALDGAAEVAVGIALVLCRRIKEGNNALERRTAKVGCPDWLLGQGLKDCICGILGLGKLGVSIAVRLQGFEPKKIVYYSRRVKNAGKKLNIERILFDEFLEMSDVIFICLPCNDTTRGMFNEETFMKMKRNSILINPSHGGLIKINELYCSLRKGVIFAAGMDTEVTDAPPPKHPILRLNNFMLLPSAGRKTALVKLRMNIMAASNLVSGLREKKLLNPLSVDSVLSVVETEEARIVREENEEALRLLAEERLRLEEEERLLHHEEEEQEEESLGEEEEQLDEEQ